MSTNNGAQPPTSTDAATSLVARDDGPPPDDTEPLPPATRTPHPAGGDIQAYLDRRDDPRQVQPPALPEPVDLTGDKELVARSTEIARANALLALQDQDHARLALLSPRERRRQRRQVEQIRATDDGIRVLDARSQLRAQRSDLRASVRTSRTRARWNVWRAKATAKQERLMDPTSRMALIHVVSVLVSSVQIGLVAAGALWCTINVGTFLNRGFTGYIIEPVFTAPLLIILSMHMLAAMNRKQFPKLPSDLEPGTPQADAAIKQRRKQILSLEITLLALATTFQISPVLPGLGKWTTFTDFMAHLVPPTMIALIVMLMPIVSGFLADLLQDAYVEAQEFKRLDADQAAVVRRAREIDDLWNAGKLRSANAADPTDRSAGPSVASVMKQLGLGKGPCQVFVDTWHLAYGPTSTKSH